MQEAVDFNCSRNIELFFAIYLNGSRVQMATEPVLTFTDQGRKVTIDVKTDEALRPRNVDIYVCESQITPSKRNWIKMKGVEKLGESEFRSTYSLVNGGEILFVFAVVDYRNGITVSTPITAHKCPKTQIVKTNLLYKNTHGEGDFTYQVNEKTLLGGAMCYTLSPITLIKGPMGISGISSSEGLLTFKVGENCVDIRRDSIFELDLYCNTEITLKVTMYVGVEGGDTVGYSVYASVTKGEVWQNVILSIKDFKTADGKSLPENFKPEYLVFSADGFFAINNVLLI